MNTVTYLLIAYSALILVNVVILAVLWRTSGTELYKTLMFAWMGALFSIPIMGLAADQPRLTRALAFSVMFAYNYGSSVVLARLADVNPRASLSFGLLAIAVLTAAGAGILGAHQLIPAYLVATAAAFPALHVALKVLFKKWKVISVPIRGFAITLLIAGLHDFDYPLMYDNPELVKIGFTIGFPIAIAYCLFGPAAIIEKVSKEKTRLAVELEHKAKLTHSAKLSALGEMAAGVAHEINNPLAIIQIAANSIRDLLAEPNVDKVHLLKTTEVINSNVQRSAKIVKGLQVFSRDSGNDPLEVKELDSIVRDTLSLCQERFKNENIRFELVLPDRPIRIGCRPTEISQVILNLLNNARDAVQSMPEKWVRLEVADESGKTAALSVVDSGPGLSEEILAKAFVPFFTTKPVGQGTGLGLAISKGIAEAHHGSLILDTRSSNTCFLLRLPQV